ncbi:DUF2306 domain-containing protein [Ruegeria sp. HKCCA6837]|uniref:DUF2306 domain-containing protein n=1 Tax=Ruegeria sp. HKCCA6837 TaxID=2682989 RepID=UPI001487A2B9|nr:DUF2306 domain-containing protein [Ruegeria sp. HKCCA6837]
MLEWSHLREEAPQIPVHALMAIAALLLGAMQLILPKGNHRHRLFGYAWALFMAGTAFNAVFIHEIRLLGSYSTIHLLIPVTLVSLFLAIKAARQGDINRHKVLMISLFALALVVTGLFTLLPGRVMNTTLFGAVHT